MTTDHSGQPALQRPDVKVYGVIPAAGRSTRMGQPKLLLPVAGRSLIARLVDSLSAAGLAGCVVVIREDDEPLRNELQGHAHLRILSVSSTEDMRETLVLGLQRLDQLFAPRSRDGWLLQPADMPLVDSRTYRTLIELWCRSPVEWQVPVFAGRRGHPLIASWSQAAAVRSLAAGSSLKSLLRHPAQPVREVPVTESGILFDVDTPADYDDLLARAASRGTSAAG